MQLNANSPRFMLAILVLAGLSFVYTLTTITVPPAPIHVSELPKTLSNIVSRGQLAQVADVTTGLVGWWKFDETSGTTAADASGHGYTATLVGSVLPQWSAGKIGGALSYSGSGSAATGNVAFPASGTFSLSFWLKTSGNYPVIGWGNGTFCYVGSSYLDRITCTVTGDSSGAPISASVIDNNVWHHIVFASSASAQTLYVDGKLEASGNQAFVGQSNQVVFGTRFFSSMNLIGALDDVRIYDHVLTAADVAAIYAAAGGTSAPVSSPTPTAVSSPLPTPAPVQTAAASVGPTISNIQISSITSSSATVSWTTNTNSSSQISYGLTSAYGSQTALNQALTTSHSQTITGLSAYTAYNFSVRSVDGTGNAASSMNGTFTTAAASQTTAPVRSLVLAPQAVGPTAWYVDSAASCGTTCDGKSWATAWTALDQVTPTQYGGPQPGDTIYISGGPSGSSQIYYTNGPWKPFGGTAAAWITWQVGQDPAHNGTMILDGSHGNPALVSGTGIQLYGATTLDRPQSNYLVISGKVTTNGVVDPNLHIKFQNYWDVGIQTSSGLTGLKLEYMDLGDRNIEFNNGFITQLEISHIHIHLSTSLDHAIGLGGTTGSTWGVNSVHDSVLEMGSSQGGTSISGGGGSDGIQWGTATDIYNNVIRSYYTPYPYATQHQDGIQAAAPYLRIHDNYCADMYNSCFFMDHLGGGEDLHDIWIYNNVLQDTVPTEFNTASRPIEGTCEYPTSGANAGIICPHIYDIRIYNNTIVDFPLAGINIDVRNSHMASWSPPIISNVEIRNNILVNDGYHGAGIVAYGSLVGLSPDFTPSGVTGVTVSNNLIDPGSQGSSSVYPPQTNALSWSPGSEQFAWYVPYATGNDFHLRGSDTSARNGGFNLFSYFTADKDGVPRPQTGSWDAGAYQYVPQTSCTGPSAFFTVSAATGYAPLTVNFDASGSNACSGSITTYAWDFGDGTVASNNASPSHTFGVGAFTVKLTVTTSGGKTSTISRTITASLAPVAGLALGVNFDNTVTDWSGKNNNSSWIGTPCYTTGIINFAGCFNGTGAATVQITANPLNDLIEGVPQITIAGWAKKSSSTVTGGFMGKYTVYELSVGGQYTGGSSYIQTTTGGASISMPPNLNNDTAWHHYALTYDGTTMTLYVDGKAVATQPLSGTVITDLYHYLDIGTQPFDSQVNQFSGAVDDVRVYNAALSPADVLALYNSRVSTAPPILNSAQPSGVLAENTTAVTLSLSTNVPATCRFSTTANTAYSAMSPSNTFATSSNGLGQTYPLTGLVPAGYAYYVRCQDLFGNTTTQDVPITFVIAAPSSPSGLVLHYDFQNDFTGGTLTDTSPTGDNAACANNGVTVNSQFNNVNQCPTKTTGPDGRQAASLTGSVCWLPSTFFAVPKVNAIDHLGQGTITIWANYNPSTDPKFQIPYTSFTYERLLDTYTSAAVNTLGSWSIARDRSLTGTPGTAFIVNNGTQSPFSVPFGDVDSHDAWNQYVATWDGTNVRVYLNGNLVQTVPESGFTSLNIGTYLTIGALNHGDGPNAPTNNCSQYVGTFLSSLNEYLYQFYGYNASQQYTMPNAGFFVGKMGDIRIYNRALAPAEIAGVYAETGGTLGTVSTVTTPTTPTPPSPITDTTPPSVSITAPSNAASVSGSTVSISVNATDNVGVAAVQLKVDGTNIPNGLLTTPTSGSTYSGTWDTTNVPNGSHILLAVASDAAGNMATSVATSITVSNATVNPTPAPVISPTPTVLPTNSPLPNPVSTTTPPTVATSTPPTIGNAPLPPPPTGGGATTGATSGTTGGSSPGSGTSGGGSSPVGTFTPAVPQKPVTTPCVSAIPASALNLTIGTRGVAVTNLQTFLVISGYLDQRYITGYYGNLTKAALASYQAAHLSNSCANLNTTLSSANAAVANANVSGSRLPSSFRFTTRLKTFTSSPDVRYLQIFLNDQGYTIRPSGTGSKGHESTYFGPSTIKALAAFQRANGITPAYGNFGMITVGRVNQFLAR